MPYHPQRIGFHNNTKIKKNYSPLNLYVMVNSLCYQIQVEIDLCCTPCASISFLHSYNHQFSYKTTPCYKDMSLL